MTGVLPSRLSAQIWLVPLHLHDIRIRRNVHFPIKMVDRATIKVSDPPKHL